MDQVKFVEDSLLKKISQKILHKFHLVHSWIFVPNLTDVINDTHETFAEKTIKPQENEVYH